MRLRLLKNILIYRYNNIRCPYNIVSIFTNIFAATANDFFPCKMKEKLKTPENPKVVKLKKNMIEK